MHARLRRKAARGRTKVSKVHPRFDYDGINTNTELLTWLNSAEKARLHQVPKRQPTRMIELDSWVLCNVPSPCGKEIAVGTDGGEVKFFDAKTHTLTKSFVPGKAGQPVSCLSYSPDSRYIALAAGPKLVIYKMDTKEQLPFAVGEGVQAGLINSLDWYGRTFDAEDDHNKVQLVVGLEGDREQMVMMEQQSSLVCGFTFTATEGSERVESMPKYATSFERILQAFCKQAHSEPPKSVEVVRYHPLDQRLIVAAEKTVFLLKVDRKHKRLREELARFPFDHEVTDVMFSLDGVSIFVATLDGKLANYRLVDGKLLQSADFNGPLRSMSISPDGLLLAAGGDDKNCTVTCLATFEQMYSFHIKSTVRAVSFTPHHGLLVGGVGRRTCVFDVLSGQVCMRFVEQLGRRSAVTAVDVSPAVTRLGKRCVLAAQGTFHGWIIVWNAAKPRQAVRKDGSTSVRPLWSHYRSHVPVRSLRFSSDGYMLVVGSADGSCIVYDSVSGHVKYNLPPRVGEVTAVDFSRDGRFLMVSGQDGVVAKHYATRGEDVQSWEHPSQVTCMAATANGKRVAVGGEDGAVVVYSTTGDTLLRLQRDGRINSVDFIDDTGKLFVCGNDCLGLGYDARGEELYRIEFTGPALVAKVSPTVDRLAVAYKDHAGDSQANMYNSLTGELIFVFDDEERCTTFGFSPDGDWMMFGNPDGDSVVCSGASQDAIPLEFIELVEARLDGPTMPYMALPSTSDLRGEDGQHLVITLLETLIKRKETALATKLLEKELAVDHVDELTFMLAIQLRDRPFLMALLHAASVSRFQPVRAAVVSVIPALIDMGFTQLLSDFMDELDLEELFTIQASHRDDPLSFVVGPFVKNYFDASFRDWDKYASKGANGAVCKARRVALPGLICRPVITALIEAEDMDLWVSPSLTTSITAAWSQFVRGHVYTVVLHLLQVTVFTIFAIYVQATHPFQTKGYILSACLMLSAAFFISIELKQYNGFYQRDTASTDADTSNYQPPTNTSWHWLLSIFQDPDESDSDLVDASSDEAVVSPLTGEVQPAEEEKKDEGPASKQYSSPSGKGPRVPKEFSLYPEAGQSLIAPEDLKTQKPVKLSAASEHKYALLKAPDGAQGEKKRNPSGEYEMVTTKAGDDIPAEAKAGAAVAQAREPSHADLASRAALPSAAYIREHTVVEVQRRCCEPSSDSACHRWWSKVPGFAFFRSVYRQMDFWNLIDLLCQIVILINGIQYCVYGPLDVERASQMTWIAIAPFFLLGRTLSLFRGFEALGWIVSVLIQNAKDMQAFLIVVAVFIFFNGISFMCLFANVPDTFEPDDDFVGEVQSFDTALLMMFNMGILGDFAVGGYPKSAAPVFTFILYVAFMVAVALVALNAVIALLGDSFEQVQERILAELNILRANLIVDYLDAQAASEAEVIEMQMRWVHELRPESQMAGNSDEWAGRMKEIEKTVTKASGRALEATKVVHEEFETELTFMRDQLANSLRMAEEEIHESVRSDLGRVRDAQARTESRLRDEINEVRGSINGTRKAVATEVAAMTSELKAEFAAHLDVIAQRLQ